MKKLLSNLGIGLISAILVISPSLVCIAGEIEEEEKEEQDFLFLLEEAYTQDQGELQINMGVEYARSKGTELEIDEDGAIEEKKQKKEVLRTPIAWEWGITDRLEAEAEMSFVYERRDSTPINTVKRDTKHVEDFEDMELGLNYLLVKESGQWPAMTLGYGYELPTGDFHEELGAQHGGHEVSLAMSKDFGRWVGHFNLGFGVHLDETKRNEDKTTSKEIDLRELSYGTAFVYRATDHMKLFLELFHEIEEEIEVNKRKSETELRILPGVSHAFEIGPEGRKHEWEFGLGFPIGVTDDAADWGVVFKGKYEYDLF